MLCDRMNRQGHRGPDKLHPGFRRSRHGYASGEVEEEDGEVQEEEGEKKEGVQLPGNFFNKSNFEKVMRLRVLG